MQGKRRDEVAVSLEQGDVLRQSLSSLQRVQHAARTRVLERRTRSQLSSRKCRPLYDSNL